MASVFRADSNDGTAYYDYPVWIVIAQIGASGHSTTAEYSLMRTQGGVAVLNDTDETALLAAINTFFEDHDWSAHGAGYALESFAVNRYDETETDATP